MKGVKIELSGKKFGRLTVLNQSIRRGGNGQIYWDCKCECGTYLSVLGHSLRIGHSVSCGCFKRDFIRSFTSIKGYDEQTTKSDEYRIWKAMRARCRNKNSAYFHIYGGKGIKVCKRWDNSFLLFLNDMGNRPSKQHSIERINGNKGYYPNNCKWATKLEQSNNTSRCVFVTYKGQRKTVAQWASVLKIKYSTLTGRLKRHSFEYAIDDRNFNKKYKILSNGKIIEFFSIKEFADDNNLSRNKLSELINGIGFYGGKNYYKGYSRIN